MAGLLGDGWFYISSAGLLVSGVLFFFLLGQYRAASEAADITESKQSDAAAVAVHPIFVREEGPNAQSAAAPVASIATDKPTEYAGPERRKDPAVTTGGISPAVVYLQNIKGELAELHQEVRALTRAVESLKTVAVAAPAQDATIRIEPSVVVDASAPESSLRAPSPSEEKPRRGPVWPV